jgi:hypothetical protein
MVARERQQLARETASASPRRGTPPHDRSRSNGAPAKRSTSRIVRSVSLSPQLSPNHVWWGILAAVIAVSVATVLVVNQRAGTASDLQLITLQGAATVTHLNGKTELAYVGMNLYKDDLISVGASSQLVARFADGSELTSSNMSEWLNEGEGVGKRLRLLAGSLTAEVAKQPRQHPMVIVSNDAEVTVLGTRLTCHYRTQSRISVTEGQVAVRRRIDGEEAKVKAGQEVAIPLEGDLQVVAHGQLPQAEVITSSETRKRGKGTGLYGQYYNNQNFTNLAFSRVDPTIDFNLGVGVAIDPRIALEYYSIRWTGEIEPLSTGTHWFRTLSDDGIRIWVDGKLIIERWTEHNATWNDGTINLEAGKRYPIRIEYDQYKRHAVLQIFWKAMGQPLGLLDSRQLYPSKPSN